MKPTTVTANNKATTTINIKNRKLSRYTFAAIVLKKTNKHSTTNRSLLACICSTANNELLYILLVVLFVH